jgi:hypothetical protein
VTLNPSSQSLTPRAAAVAGVIFSVLMIVSLVIVRVVVDPVKPGGWLTDPAKQSLLNFALNLTPFAGIAFLWFLGVLRSRLGALEDRFFSTVFFGSGLLFVACLFSATAIAEAFFETLTDRGSYPLASETVHFVRRVSSVFVNVFAIKMAGVFIFSTCTIALHTAILPRWLAFVGFACGMLLLLVITRWEWIALLFPLWILLVSAQFLLGNRNRSHKKTSRELDPVKAGES